MVVAHPSGLEPETYRLEVCRSIQLSYGCKGVVEMLGTAPRSKKSGLYTWAIIILLTLLNLSILVHPLDGRTGGTRTRTFKFLRFVPLPIGLLSLTTYYSHPSVKTSCEGIN